jgi:hypothetical protein
MKITLDTKKKRSLSYTLVFSAILYCLLLACLTQAADLTLSDQLEAWGATMKTLSPFSIIDRDTQMREAIKIEYLTAKSDSKTLRIQRMVGLSEVDAKRYIDDRTAEIISVYDPRPAPYFAFLTQSVQCPTKFKPLMDRPKTTDHNLVSFTMFADDRFTYGVCDDASAMYRAVFAFAYCKTDSAVYSIEYFVPTDGFSKGDLEMIHSFSCASKG